ncbi:Fibronectin/fibrinogen-binding protein [Nitrospira tepida]|uniref:Fibronectin/fibrinogen-binding protein n=1 Tax=Nitrospira tepida TaxID=2973512 RepID=A0AA86N1D7_9BACT|nr:NFACT family protein [Nitrospira tepida]CAI4032937.1 Fibronectin/fibrinogen-binding protein [Nitrospira tepida]
MSLSAAEIGAVLSEIRPALLGGWVQKIYQPTDTAITLEVRVPGKTVALHLSVFPGATRLHLLSAHLPNPERPPSFCQLLRAHLLGARVEELQQWQGDRIVEIRLQTKEGTRTLAAELTGRSANLFYVDATGHVRAALRPAPERTGKPWLAGIGQPGTDPPQTTRQRFTPSSASADDPDYPVSQAIEQHYAQEESEAQARRLEQERLQSLTRQLKRLTRRILGMEEDLDKARRYESYGRYGELLKAHLAQVQKGQDRVTVEDYFDPELTPITIPLDPAKTPTANMHDYFQKHRKFLAAETEIRPRLEAAEREQTQLREEIDRIRRGEWRPPAGKEPTTNRRRSQLGDRQGRPGHAPPRRGPFRRFTSVDGHPIYVGRNAQENEELTHRFAQGDDLWLHARGVPGSHVVVRLPKGLEPPLETLRDAATLAILYSDFKKSGKGDVIYTRKKWVKKAKGRAAGTVTVTQERTIFLQLDKTRLDRLKNTAGLLHRDHEIN